MKRARNKRFKKYDGEENLNIQKNSYEEYDKEENIEFSYREEPDDFAVSTDEIPDEYIAPVIEEPNDFQVEELPEDVLPQNEAQDLYSETPENEIPFSAPDFEEEDIEEDLPQKEKVETPHTDELLQRKAMNKKKFEEKRRRRRRITVFTGLFLLILLAGTIILGLDFSGGSSHTFTTPVDTATGKLNILLLGVDKDGERSDSIMLASYDFDDHSINLLSVPRDTKMYVEDRGVTRKITEVHGMHNSSGKMYGAAAVAESVTALTGIPINYYLEFSFDAIDQVMDILGPVTFDVPDIEGKGRGMNYDDGYQNLHIHLKPGVQELSGNQIQQFLRYRKSNYGTSDGSDISRVGRQQELLKAIIDQKVNLELIVKLPDIFKEIKSQIKTNFGLGDIIKYAVHLKNVSSENMTTYVLPGESGKTNGIWYYNSDLDQVATLVTDTFGYEVTPDELTNVINLTGKKAAGSAGKSKSSETTKSASSDDTKNETTKNDDKKTTSTKKDDDESKSSDTTKKDTTQDKVTSKSDEPSKSDSTTSEKEDDDKKTESPKEDTPSKNDTTSKEEEPKKTAQTGKPAEDEKDEDETISLD